MKITYAIESERLLLRAFDLGDLEDLYAFASDDEVTRNAGWKKHSCLADSADLILHALNKPTEWAIVLKSENRVIGSLGLSEDILKPAVGKCMVGFLLAKEYWGFGYAYEATNTLLEYISSIYDFEVITAYHYLDNRRSEALIKRLGFTYKGIAKDAIKNVDDEIVDLCCYEKKKSYDYNTFKVNTK
ncbi:ribosomal-protein-alanine N-acetyltransferase [Breznakia sp. PF5-3]|uniref:GNAT family N-acetyltransferase n=1 Tax=unclassified Breznakia TaxID=2623764 RepID=UPI0024074336|nr:MULTISPECIES: GNAT family N-acetyltransferase [unclassified Breznakia]MDF9825264.1 ribosomal-protein-alanine N-acetyltransferase [Breznakia sp. PM6-1]MDF9836146.1 ribosomal-protein-alanine N-acetyltransferase [Breznakia sp. PF5-3]MDF9838167.1 ribosomal-protein-alanine N-acetyltransferase [Breznakia sp. PFB2-8]MDF9860153.1 ribosomal-protein-alanine N-acetyltransferase [Breznakia sp. PH5-24]